MDTLAAEGLFLYFTFVCFVAVQPSLFTFLTEDQSVVTKMYQVVCTCGIGFVNINDLLLILAGLQHDVLVLRLCFFSCTLLLFYFRLVSAEHL